MKFVLLCGIDEHRSPLVDVVGFHSHGISLLSSDRFLDHLKAFLIQTHGRGDEQLERLAVNELK
jgi:hypothetical protein